MADNKEKIYDYFKNDNFIFNGRFARYVDKMWTRGTIEEDDKFDRLLDLYAVSAVWGLLIGKRLEDDSDKTDKRTIPLEQISSEYRRFRTIMQVILLLDKSRGMSIEEKVKIAFDENAKTKQRYEEDMDLFNSYVRGGLEYLYEQLELRTSNPDDYFEDVRIANIMALVEKDLETDMDIVI